MPRRIMGPAQRTQAPALRSFLLCALLSIVTLARAPRIVRADDAASGGRVAWTMDETYHGSHQDSFEKLRWQVPVLMRQTLIDLAVRLGLDFQEGWSFPMTVRFVDGAPNGVENILAYVQLLKDDHGNPAQTLNVNLRAYDQQGFDFEKVFAHELVHAMLNDAMGPQASNRLPVWLHEGLAVYGADQGEALVRVVSSRYAEQSPESLLNGLEGPHSGIDYAEDYLAFKYMHDRLGVNALHNFVGELVRRKGDIPGAIEYTCDEDWDTFQKEAKAFGVEEIENIRRNERGPAPTKPY